MAAQWEIGEWKDYALLDCGDGWKVERFGKYTLLRPETAAIWPPEHSRSHWEQHVDASFEFTNKKSGKWVVDGGMPERWTLPVPASAGGFRMNLELTAFKHVGVFPEHLSNWVYINEQCKRFTQPKVLNLFAYTGAASLAAKAAGADVTHVDSIKQVINWTNDNMVSSGLDGIRWVVEDALKFMRREVKRGNTYHGLIMDPPTFGMGAKGEKWRIEEMVNPLFEAAAALLEPEHFCLVTTYSGLTPTVVESLARRHMPGSHAEARELVIASEGGVRVPLGNTLRCWAG